MAGRSVTLAAATRAYPGVVANGDAWQVDWTAVGCRITLIDGLGHGPAAAEAAAAALSRLAAEPDLGPVPAIHACHVALAHTRGAAMGVVVIEPDSGRLIFAGVGNVEARLYQGGREQRLICDRGIIGARLPRVRETIADLLPGWLLLIYTDGISAEFTLADLPEALLRKPDALAQALLRDRGRQTDDATMLVARRT